MLKLSLPDISRVHVGTLYLNPAGPKFIDIMNAIEKNDVAKVSELID